MADNQGQSLSYIEDKTKLEKIRLLLKTGMSEYPSNSHEYYICKDYIGSIEHGSLTERDIKFLSDRLNKLNWKGIE